MKTTYHILSRGLCLLAFCFAAFTASGQTPGIEYFMKSSYQKQTFNPALRAQQGYIGFPLLTNTSGQFQTNTLNLDHLVFDTGRADLVTFLHPDVSADDFLSNMADNNKLSVNVNETVFSYGNYIGEKGYLFVDLSGRASLNANIPYSLFEFAKKGIAQNEDSYYEIKDLAADLMLFVDLGVGYSHSLLDDKLVVGGKFKVLLGWLQADAKINNMKIDAGLDRWIVGADAQIEGYAPFDIPVQYDADGRFDWFGEINPAFGISGFGVGFDVGAAFNLSGIDGGASDILSRFNVSLAFTDIGFISWNKNDATILNSTLEDTVVTGDYVVDLNNTNSLEEEIEEIGDTLKDIIDFKEQAQQGKTTSLNTNMNFGVEYEVMPQLTVGFLSSTRFNAIHTFSEFTLGGSYRPCDWFEAGLSYSFVYNKFNTFGLALHLAPKKGVNFFLSADYLLPSVNDMYIPVKAKGVNAMLGVSIPIGKRI